MSERITVSKPLIEPVYWQSAPSQQIDLGKVALEFALDGNAFDAMAQVSMRFLPDDRLMFTVAPTDESERPPMSVEDKFKAFSAHIGTAGAPVDRTMTEAQMKVALAYGFWPGGKWDGKLVLKDRGVTVDAFCVKSGGDGTIEFMPSVSVVTTTPPANNIAIAKFHLFNFPKFSGPDNYIITSDTQTRHISTACGRAILKADGWVVTIAATDKTDDLCKALEAQGGYAITHMGEIKREDGAAFSTHQLDDLMHCLHAFLSFVLGRWAGLAFPVGFDKAGNKVFEQWGLPSTASGDWHGSKSWFDEHHGELLAETFPGFLALWKDSLWHEALWKATYWYLIANDSNVDSGLILAQTALELLAWTYCVEQRRMASAQAFGERGGLCAADKLRILASTLAIPLGLPAHLDALNAPMPGRKWQDAMDAITGIRNVLVHPHAKTEPPKGSYYEAAKLSLWYLDLILLRLCGHKGKYGNRLASPRWTGSVESVPWANGEPEKAGV